STITLLQGSRVSPPAFPTRLSSDLPVLAAALEGDALPGARDAARDSFQRFQDLHIQLLRRAGVSAERARSLAAIAVSAIEGAIIDRKSTRLKSSHLVISYAVFCLKKQTSELQSPCNLVCRLLLEKKKKPDVVGIRVRAERLVRRSYHERVVVLQSFLQHTSCHDVV